MTLRQKIFAIVVAAALLVVLIDLVRRRRMREEYSWLWLLTGATVLVVVIWYDLLVWLSRLIGAVTVTTTLFMVAILFLMAIALHFSIKISRLENNLKELAQHHALLAAETRAAPGPPPATAAGREVAG
jgi:hypothetical protein